MKHACNAVMPAACTVSLAGILAENMIPFK